MPDIPQVLTPNTWPVGTEVVLLQVPWDANYRDIVIWDNQQQRDDYFDTAYAGDSKRWTSAKFSYLPPNEPINIPVPYSAAYKYNYVVVQNPMQPVEYEEQPIRLCYFITSASYINPQTTMITLQLDVIQTYQFGVSIDRLFAVSGHAAISNTVMNQSLSGITGNTLRRYCDIDEGVSVGNTYAIIGKEWFPFTEPDSGELGGLSSHPRPIWLPTLARLIRRTSTWLTDNRRTACPRVAMCIPCGKPYSSNSWKRCSRSHG